MDQITTEKSTITEVERARRKEAIDFARGSVRLEGYVLDSQAEDIFRQHVNGEISDEEFRKAVNGLMDSYGG
ncbi:antitoxin VbhA family protein [Acidiphilium sp.]|uniref:antitoxin VbhA family protein n=1 Tax=Acidiphilium sp. TaxID=527 RepID=UPI003D08DB8A